MKSTFLQSAAAIIALAVLLLAGPASSPVYAQSTTATITVIDGDTGLPLVTQAQVQITYAGLARTDSALTIAGVAAFPGGVLPGVAAKVNVALLDGSGRTDTQSVAPPGFLSGINNAMQVIVAPTLGEFSPGAEGQIWQQMLPFGAGLDQAPAGFSCNNDWQDSPTPVTTCTQLGGATGTAAPLGLVAFPLGIALDSQNGILYVSDNYNNRIQAFTTNTNTLDVTPLPLTVPPGNGEPGQGPYGATAFFDVDGASLGTVAGGEKLSQPRGVRVDAAHHVIVADYWNGRVVVFQGCAVLGSNGRCDLSQQPVSGGQPIPDGTLLFELNLPSLGGDGPRATGIGLTPGAVLTNGGVPNPADARRFIVTDDWNGAVYVYNSDLALISSFLTYTGPTGVAVQTPVNGASHFFVADQAGYVSVFDQDGSYLDVFGSGQDANGVQITPATPWDVLIDHRGRLVVSDRDNQRLVLYDAVTHAPIYFLDAANFNGYPAGIVEDMLGGLDPAGKIYATDVGNQRIQRFQVPDLAVVEPAADSASKTGSYSVVVPVGKLKVAAVSPVVTPTGGTAAVTSGQAPAPVPWIFPGQSKAFTFAYSGDSAAFDIVAVGNHGATTSNHAIAKAAVACGLTCGSSVSVVALGAGPVFPAVAVSADWYNTTVTLRIHATSTLGLAAIRYQLGGVQAGGIVTVEQNGALTGDVDILIDTNGASTLEYWAVNTDGSEEQPHRVDAIALDLDRPVLHYDFTQPLQLSSGTSPDGKIWWNSASVTVPFTFSDNTTASTATWPGNSLNTPARTEKSGSLTFSTPVATSATGLFGTVVVTDIASNTFSGRSDDAGCCLGMPVNIDRVAPTVTVAPASLTIQLDSPTSATLNPASFTVNAVDDLNGSGFKVGSILCAKTAGGPCTTFPVGTTSVTFTARDYAGNVGSRTATVIVTDAAPAFNVSNVSVVAQSAAGFAGSVAIPAYTVPTATDFKDATAPLVSCLPGPTAIFGFTPTLVTCSATNTSGQTTRHTFTVTVTDTPPTFSVANVTIPANSAAGFAGSVATPAYTVPTASDFKDTTAPVVCSPAPTAAFGFGAAVAVTCTATNSSGQQTTHAFTVTVTDPPRFTLANLTVVANAAAGFVGSTATPAYSVPTASVFQGAVPVVTCVPGPTTTFAMGATAVTCTATNGSGTTTHTFTVTVKSPNEAPVCTAAVASPSLLWPPNHKLVPITISGITDPDGNTLTQKILKIYQDEPTNGGGDGSTSVDGFGVGTGQASVRAERSGNRNGRVYYITFSATDPSGASCTGTVTVGVPHDMAHPAVGDGPVYDSTKAGPAEDDDEHHGCNDSRDHEKDNDRDRDIHDRKYHGKQNDSTKDDNKKS